MRTEPKYRDHRFETEELFEQWLHQIAKKQIIFRDHQQDLTSIWIDEEGEILHANLQTSIWCGKIVNIASLKLFTPIEIWDKDLNCFDTFHRLVPEEINLINQ